MWKAVCLKLLQEGILRQPPPVLVSWGGNMLKVTGHNLVENSRVVQFYAASCTIELELLMAMKRKGDAADFDVFTDRSQDMLRLMKSLFRAMEIPGCEENEQLMRCIHLILGLVDFGGDINQLCFNSLLQKRTFFPRMILKNGITDASLPLLAQLLELATPPISPIYMAIFSLILQPETWKPCCNFEDLVRFLEPFLHKAPGEASDKLSQVLWLIEELASSPVTKDRGFQLLTAVFQLDYIEEHLTEANKTYMVQLYARYQQ
ncbi:unnamed protein product [Microthlaspi erraticum]|uniref:Exportin-2 C-terminal domain-containing protein n=1 Tax=Microthlaspi erraticum TaxID=1685480 RepID=A0A6D2HGM6_9BRAS|nr:unnamed protein product [Microthlaspi erraticum]CAA7052971.1 unnamed protein product [Microthlaspi erraticum]